MKIGFVRLAYGGWHHAAVGDWLSRTLLDASRKPEITDIASTWFDRSPVYRARNSAVAWALAQGCDYLCMVDADMIPDVNPKASPFWSTSLDFAVSQGHPCVVVAPALNSNNECCIHTERTDALGRHLELMSAQDAVLRTGFEKIAGCGLGLVLIDCRCFDRIPQPYFQFVYTDRSCTEIKFGEDVLFTSMCSSHGIPVYVNWDCWAGHEKRVILGCHV